MVRFTSVIFKIEGEVMIWRGSFSFSESMD